MRSRPASVWTSTVLILLAVALCAIAGAARPLASNAAPLPGIHVGVGPEYTVAETVGRTLPGATPSVAFDGSNYFVVWADSRGQGDIYGARVTPAGQVLDVGGIAVSTESHDQSNPEVAFDGTNYFVVWTDTRG